MTTNEEAVKESPARNDEGQQFEWTDYFFILLTHAWVIAAVTSACFIVATFHFFSLPNLYSATVTILAEQALNAPQSQQGVTMPAFEQAEDYYGTQLSVLISHTIHFEVEKELGTSIAGARLDPRRLRGTRIIALTVTHPKPEMASKIANKFAEVYVRESVHQGTFIGEQILKLLPQSSNESAPGGGSEIGPGGFNKDEFASSLTSVSNDLEIRQLSNEKLAIQSKLTDLSQRYKAEHPAIIELKERLSIIESDINKRRDTILSNVKVNLSGKVNITNIRILEYALTPEWPSEPNRSKGILLWTLAGFFSTIFFVLALEYTNQKIRAENDIISLGICFLGYIPLVKEFLKGQKYHAFPEEPDLVRLLKSNATLADAVANARTHILFSMPYEKSRRIMLTSAIPGEGKSTFAALLAYSLTTLGRRILLIDGDLRKPSLHNYLGVKNEKGLTDFLVGAATIEEIIQPVKNSQLQLITAGSISRNPSELLASERFRDLLDQCGERFDRLVIDVPPVLYIPDGLIVAKIVRTGILICGAGMVHKKTVRQVKEKFDSVGYSFIGAIVNRADFEKQSYRYKYYGAYKNYYAPSHRPAAPGASELKK